MHALWGGWMYCEIDVCTVRWLNALWDRCMHCEVVECTVRMCCVLSLATIRSKYYFNFILNRTRSCWELFDHPLCTVRYEMHCQVTRCTVRLLNAVPVSGMRSAIRQCILLVVSAFHCLSVVTNKQKFDCVLVPLSLLARHVTWNCCALVCYRAQSSAGSDEQSATWWTTETKAATDSVEWASWQQYRADGCQRHCWEGVSGECWVLRRCVWRVLSAVVFSSLWDLLQL